MTTPSKLCESLKRSEGFRGMPYDDHLGNPTIGYGTLLPITPDEGELLLNHRLAAAKTELCVVLERSGYHIDFYRLPEGVRDALCDMAYNMGVPRLMGFKRMLTAVQDRDWPRAKAEALDSRWAKQVPNRAKKVVEGFA